MSTHPQRSLSGSKAAAAVLNAGISAVGLVVSIAPLRLGAEGASANGDNPPFAALVVGVILGVLGLVGSFGIWRGERWGLILTIVIRGLDGLASLFGIFAEDTTLRILAIVSVVGAAAVIFLLLRPDARERGDDPSMKVTQPDDLPHRPVAGAVLTYGLLLSYCAALYVLVLAIGGVRDGHAGEAWLYAVATVAVVATVEPVRRWLRRNVEELIHGHHEDAYGAIVSLQRELDVDPSSGSSPLPAIIARSVNLPYVTIELPGEPPQVYGEPVPGTETTRLPIVFRAEHLGTVTAGPRRRGVPLSTADLVLLQDLTGQVAVSVFAQRAAAEVQESRAELVTAREEERRRIRRDLHDGLGSDPRRDATAAQGRPTTAARQPFSGVGHRCRPARRRSEHGRRHPTPRLRPPAATTRRARTGGRAAPAVDGPGSSRARHRHRSRAARAPGSGRGGGLPDRHRGPPERGQTRRCRDRPRRPREHG